ncbi:MAG: glycosyltransferase family 2 protein [Dehalococcoidia bacterium]
MNPRQMFQVLSQARQTRPTVSVVIPALNEADNLPYVLPLIPFDEVDEVVLVDGGSTDGTVEVARALVPDIRVVTQLGRGKGDALQAGFEASIGDIIVALDADGSTDPREIPLFIGALVSGADYVKGSRFMQGGGTDDMPLLRRAGNWGLTMLVRALYGGRYTDLCYGYNAFWRWALPALHLDADGFEIETLMNIRALRSGLRVTEVMSFEAPRIHGEGRLQTFPDGFRVLRTILSERIRPQQRVARQLQPAFATRRPAPVAVIEPVHERTNGIAQVNGVSAR